jgi:hypothetical protein
MKLKNILLIGMIFTGIVQAQEVEDKNPFESENATVVFDDNPLIATAGKDDAEVYEPTMGDRVPTNPGVPLGYTVAEPGPGQTVVVASDLENPVDMLTGATRTQVEQLLSENECPGCMLDRPDLAGKDLQNANLRGASLKNANLKDADLSGANLENADLTGANLENINLTGAKTSGIKGLPGR